MEYLIKKFYIVSLCTHYNEMCSTHTKKNVECYLTTYYNMHNFIIWWATDEASGQDYLVFDGSKQTAHFSSNIVFRSKSCNLVIIAEVWAVYSRMRSGMVCLLAILSALHYGWTNGMGLDSK